MWKRTVGVLAAVAIIAILAFGAVAFAESVTWTAPTTWTNGTAVTAAEQATFTYYIRINKPNPKDGTGVAGWYYLGEVRNGGSFFPADNSLSSLMRSYGFSGQMVNFTVSAAFVDTDGKEYDSDKSLELSWTVPTNQVASATLSPAPGSYVTEQSVTLSTTMAGASIRYTTDGTTPSATTGTVYSTPIAVGEGTTTIKAIAYKSGMADSAVTSGTYIVTLPFQPRKPTAPSAPVIQ